MLPAQQRPLADPSSPSVLQAALLTSSGQTTPAHTAAMEQMRALAEASLQELQARIGERDAQIARLQARLAEQQGAALEQQQKARQELQALSHKLLEQEAGALQGLRAALSQAQVQVRGSAHRGPRPAAVRTVQDTVARQLP
jgi:ATP/maltotriose-dependent transcriptional regulator MalT